MDEPTPIRLRKKLATRRRTIDIMRAQGRPVPQVWEHEVEMWEAILDDFFSEV